MSAMSDDDQRARAARFLPSMRLASLREIFSVDLRTLALFRVGLATIILFDLLLRTRDFAAFHTDFGVFPRAVAITNLNIWGWSFHLAGGSAWFIGVLFVIAAVFAVMLLVGYRTRLASVASWAFLLSLQNRNTMILTGEDVLLLALAFWGMFLPLGARFSVDAALDTREVRSSNTYFSVASFALLIQGMSMYVFSALLKSDPKWIPDGTAVYYALQLDYFATPFALWLREFGPLLQGLTYFVWTLELIGPLLIFSPLFLRPLRASMQLAFISMHVGFFLCLEIGLFPIVSILMNLTFTQGWVWEALDRRYARHEARGLTIFYDGPCDFCRKICLILRTFLILPRAPVRPAQDDPAALELLQEKDSWVLRNSDGASHVRWDAMVRLFAASPLFWPIATLMSPGWARSAGERIYAFVARRRGRFSGYTSKFLPYRPVSLARPAWREGLAGLALLMITFQNVSSVPEFGINRPDWFVNVREAARFYQNWAMFAPYPEVTSPWAVIPGNLRDGTPVDVKNGVPGTPSFDKPRFVAATYRNYRWRRFLAYIEDMSYQNQTQIYGLEYARWLCRSWNWGTQRDKQLTTFDIYFMVEWTQPNYAAKSPVKRHVWRHDCFG